ncbi:hypothetical protein [Parvibaculum sp.]|uniref:hypothetical protein n=1 Tax=Parvibaculum sp. TaxID=2024848 RepID=UPI003296FBB2
MKRLSRKALVSILAVLSLAACTSQNNASIEPPGSRAEAVLDAQYAAEGRQPPMQSAEADRIYDAYLEGIGKKSKEKASDPGKSR